MSVGPSRSAVPLKDLGELLPWSFGVDQDLRISYLGSSLCRRVTRLRPGVLFNECVSFVRPGCTISSFDDLLALADRMIVINVSELSVPLHGSVFKISEKGSCIIAVSPVIRSQSEFGDSELELADFALHGSLPDLLFALQARDLACEEAEESSQRREEARGRLKSILDSALDAMITIDYEGNIVEFNDVASTLFGHVRADVIGKELTTIIVPPSQRAHHLAGMARYRETGEGPILSQRIKVDAMRFDGTEFPVELAVIPFVYKGQNYFTATIRDLTAERASERALAHAAEQQHLLNRELDHRVKNMLSQIIVLCRQAESSATEDRELIGSLLNRIRSFSDVHELLSRERAIGIDAHELVRLCLAPYVDEQNEMVSIAGPKCRILPTAAMTLAMVFNELVTNAAKHGALKKGGNIELAWSIDQGEPSIFTLCWRESHAVGGPAKISGGFGTEILKAVIGHELGGTVELCPVDNGLLYSARIPLDSVLQDA